MPKHSFSESAPPGSPHRVSVFSRPPRVGWESWIFIGILLTLTSCGGSSPAPGTLVPLVNATGTADNALSATRPDSPMRMVFDYRVREADLRFNGRGLARVEPPYKVRLDLFSTGGETLFEAALVEGTLRIPPWAPRELAPPPALLWAALGVFRPDPDMDLLEARAEQGEVMNLRYGRGEDLELRFKLDAGHLIRAELHREGHLAEEVDLSLEEGTGTVLETVYRNMALFLELTFTLDSVETVDPFSPDIWHPGL